MTSPNNFNQLLLAITVQFVISSIHFLPLDLKLNGEFKCLIIANSSRTYQRESISSCNDSKSIHNGLSRKHFADA